MNIWKELAVRSDLTFVVIQFTFLIVVAILRMRYHINTRIGGMEAIEIRSWPRLIAGIVACNATFLWLHHSYLSFWPSPESDWSSLWSRFLFFVLYILMLIIGWIIAVVIGVLFDYGKALLVVTDRFKPEHSPNLSDMTRDEGRLSHLIARGAFYAYQYLMIYTFVVFFWK
jgi:hypothetical protein